MSDLDELYLKDLLKMASYTTVYQACVSMAKMNVGAVLIVEGTQYIGIFSERDVMKRVIVKGLDPMDTP